jgi:hypothetical protein
MSSVQAAAAAGCVNGHRPAPAARPVCRVRGLARGVMRRVQPYPPSSVGEIPHTPELLADVPHAGLRAQTIGSQSSGRHRQLGSKIRDRCRWCPSQGVRTEPKVAQGAELQREPKSIGTAGVYWNLLPVCIREGEEPCEIIGWNVHGKSIQSLPLCL